MTKAAKQEKRDRGDYADIVRHTAYTPAQHTPQHTQGNATMEACQPSGHTAASGTGKLNSSASIATVREGSTGSAHTSHSFTPGPWKVESDDCPWTCGDSQTAVECGEEFGHTEILFTLHAGDASEPLGHLVWEPLASKERQAELNANARLIAQAPTLAAHNAELLAALRIISRRLNQAANGGLKTPGKSDSMAAAKWLMRSCRDDADAAIRRAEGGA